MSISLLKVLSSRGNITLDEYYKIFDYFYPSKDEEIEDRKKLQHRLLYYLVALGHCEFDYEAGKVYVCKPTLAVLPGTGSLRTILCGARDDEIINKLHKFQKAHGKEVEINFVSQKRDGIELPNVIKIKTIYRDTLLELKESIGADFQAEIPTSWLLINSSADMKEYESTLKKEPLVDLNWPVTFFNTKKLCFQRLKPKDTYILLKEYINPITRRRKYYIDIGNESISVDLDWGRYYLFSKLRKRVLLYDEKKQALGVPCYVPLPKILSRAMTLCSGISPVKAEIRHQEESLNGILIYIYSGVDKQIAQLLAKKIDQTILEYSFKNDEIGGINDDRPN